MKYLGWILGLFGAAVALSAVAHNSGYVLLVLPPYRIEISMTAFVAILSLTFVLVYFLIRLAVELFQLPSYVRKYREERVQKKMRQSLEEELTAFFEGRYADSEKLASRAIELGDTSSLHPIVAARSAHELRDFKKRDEYLTTAKVATGRDSAMRLMASGKFFLDQRDPQGTLNVLNELRDSGIKDHIGALSLELKANRYAGNWEAVLDVLDRLEKRKGIEKPIASQIRQQAWLGIVDQQNDLRGLSACMKKIPSELMKKSRIASACARGLIKYKDFRKAVELLTNSLNANWDDELVSLYGDCLSDDVVYQIEQAEKWLSEHRQDAGLLLALGKLCLHQKLWGKARNYLDASNSIAPSNAAFTTLAKLAERQGNSEEATGFYQRAMSLSNQ